MPQRRVCRIVGAMALLSAVVSLAGCGHSPNAPTTLEPSVATATVTVSAAMLTATPTSPQNAAIVDNGSAPVTLIATVPAPPAGALIVDTFDIDDNAAFTSPTSHAVARQSGTTSTIFNDARIEKDFYWRVRASSGEQLGAYSETFRFHVPAESLRAPVMLLPVSGSIQVSRPDLTIKRVTHSTDPFDRSWSYEFQISRDQSFSAVVDSPRISEGLGVLHASPAAALSAGIYFWRVRTIDESGRASAFGETWSFEVSEPFAATPVPIAPAAGATITQFAAFTVNNGRVFDDDTGAQVRVELSTTPGFETVAAWSTGWAYNGGVTTVTISRQLPGGTYYWRARTTLLKTPARPEISSGWSETRPVVLAGQVLGAPALLSPSAHATTTLRPTLTVGNVTRSQAGSMTYRFEISTDAQFADAPFASGTAAEGNGMTGWTTPFELPVGIRLWWRAQATDAATGTTGPYSETSSFAAVDRETHLYTLTIGVPASCSFITSAPSFYLQSSDPFGTAHLRLVALDAVYYTADTMVLDVATDTAGNVIGTLGGSAASGLIPFYVQAPGTSAPALLTGVATAAGMNGTFPGRLVKSSPSGGGTCNSTALTWSVVPRKQ